MAAGIASLKMLRNEPPYEKLSNYGDQLAKGLREIATEKSIPLQVPQTGSMYCLFFSENPVTNYEQAISCHHETFNSIFHKMIELGIYLPPSSYETCFISAAHTEENLHKTLDAFRHCF